MTGEGSLFDIPPAAIGRFRVLHQVGAGTCGPVFRGDDPETATPVAIKLFTLNIGPDRAAPLAERLTDLVARTPPLAAVVAPLEAGLHDGTAYLATTFAAGDSLDVALKHFGPAALIDLVPRLRMLAAALDAAAARQLVHGALHPRDVIVSETDTHLTGLGVWPVLAGLGVRLPRRNPYRAPELGEGAVSAAGDQFSLGALAYEWMTGRRAPSMFVAGDMAPVPGADRDALAALFATVLNADPAARFSSCGAFVSALAEIEQELADDPPPADASSRRRARTPDLPLLAAEDSPLADFPTQQEGEEDAVVVVPSVGTAHGRDDVSLTSGAVEPDWRLHDVGASPEPDLPLTEPTSPPAPVTEIPPTFSPASSREPDERRLRPMPVSSRPRWPLAAMLALGLGLGLTIGYLTWGRPPNAGPDVPAARGTADAPSAPVPVPAVPSSDPAPESAPSSAPPPAAPAASPPAPAAPSATPSAVVPAPEGSLLVRSTPAGATVLVDNERRGVTPVTVPGLPLGTRVVRVQRDGFVTEERRVALSSGRPSRSLDVTLTRRPAAAAGAPASTQSSPTARAKTGTLLVESRPAGATVYINGRPAGTTPVTLDDLAPGSYAVQMQLAGFRPLTTTVRVVAGERTRAGASLTRAQEPE